MTGGKLEDKGPSFVSIVIISYNGGKWLDSCLTSIKDLKYTPYEVILVDNASRDVSLQHVEKYFPWVKIEKSRKNLGYAEGCNLGASLAKGNIIVFLNQDVKVDPFWLSHLVSVLNQNNVGACCGRLLDYEGTNVLFPEETDLLDESQHQEIKMVYGAAFATRKDVIEKIGLFDPKFFMYYDEIDWSWRLRLANYKCIYVPNAIAHHWVGGSDTPFDRIVYLTCRNRIRTLIKNCELKTLFSFAPNIALEMIYWLLPSPNHYTASSRFSENQKKGVNGLILFKECLKGIIWNIMNIKDTLNERRKVQRIRVNSDKSLNAKEQDFFYWKLLKIRRQKDFLCD